MTEKRPAHPLPTLALLFMLCAIIVTSLALASRFHGFRIFDDAYMFLRYADHILAGEGMVWNIGEGPVYGATSLAYVFSLIPFRLLFPENGTAALFCSSFFWGIAFLALMFRLALVTLKPNKSSKIFLAGFLFLSLVTCASTLKTHFSSGMETTMVMTYLAYSLLLLERMRQGRGNWIVTGLVLGLAWLIRPDLILFSLGIPGLIFLLAKENRTIWLKTSILVVLITILSLFAAKLIAGSMLPMSFFAKSMKIYGPEFAATYSGQSLGEFVRFGKHIWPAVVLIGLAAFVRWPRLLSSKTAMDQAIWIMSSVFAFYYLFFVLQIMGFGQRFYYPLLPFIWYLSLREIQTFPENLARHQGLKLENLPKTWQAIGLGILAVVLGFYCVDYSMHLKKMLPKEPLAMFDAPTVYRKSYDDYWPRLLELQKVEGDFSIATTEVGMPAVLFPCHVIHDISGLNAAKLIAEGLNAETIMRYCQADLLLLPHPNYVRLNRELQASQAFQTAYIQIPAAKFEAELAVAIKKDSPFRDALLAVYPQ